jgi:CO/xanthine dehydrogenase FAD-binding subunit
VVAGAVAERPQELEAAEARARGQRLTDELLDEVGQAYAAGIDALSDIRGSDWYRQQVTRVLVRRAVQQALAGGNGRA